MIPNPQVVDTQVVDTNKSYHSLGVTLTPPPPTEKPPTIARFITPPITLTPSNESLVTIGPRHALGVLPKTYLQTRRSNDKTSGSSSCSYSDEDSGKGSKNDPNTLSSNANLKKGGILEYDIKSNEYYTKLSEFDSNHSSASFVNCGDEMYRKIDMAHGMVAELDKTYDNLTFLIDQLLYTRKTLSEHMCRSFNNIFERSSNYNTLCASLRSDRERRRLEYTGLPELSYYINPKDPYSGAFSNLDGDTWKNILFVASKENLLYFKDWLNLSMVSKKANETILERYFWNPIRCNVIETQYAESVKKHFKDMCIPVRWDINAVHTNMSQNYETYESLKYKITNRLYVDWLPVCRLLGIIDEPGLNANRIDDDNDDNNTLLRIFNLNYNFICGDCRSLWFGCTECVLLWDDVIRYFRAKHHLFAIVIHTVSRGFDSRFANGYNICPWSFHTIYDKMKNFIEALECGTVIAYLEGLLDVASSQQSYSNHDPFTEDDIEKYAKNIRNINVEDFINEKFDFCDISSAYADEMTRKSTTYDVRCTIDTRNQERKSQKFHGIMSFREAIVKLFKYLVRMKMMLCSNESERYSSRANPNLLKFDIEQGSHHKPFVLKKIRSESWDEWQRSMLYPIKTTSVCNMMTHNHRSGQWLTQTLNINPTDVVIGTEPNLDIYEGWLKERSQLYPAYHDAFTNLNTRNYSAHIKYVKSKLYELYARENNAAGTWRSPPPPTRIVSEVLSDDNMSIKRANRTILPHRDGDSIKVPNSPTIPNTSDHGFTDSFPSVISDSEEEDDGYERFDDIYYNVAELSFEQLFKDMRKNRAKRKRSNSKDDENIEIALEHRDKRSKI